MTGITTKLLLAVATAALTGTAQSQYSYVCLGATQLGDDCGVIPLPPNEFDPDPPQLEDPDGARLWAWPFCHWQELTIPAVSGYRGWFHAWFENGNANWANIGICPTNQEQFMLELWGPGGYEGDTYGCDVPDYCL